MISSLFVFDHDHGQQDQQSQGLMWFMQSSNNFYVLLENSLIFYFTLFRDMTTMNLMISHLLKKKFAMWGL